MNTARDIGPVTCDTNKKMLNPIMTTVSIQETICIALDNLNSDDMTAAAEESLTIGMITGGRHTLSKCISIHIHALSPYLPLKNI